MAKSKLHELLAVESQLKGQAETTRKELAHTFDKKRHLFEEKRITSRPLDEKGEAKVESQSDIQTNVADELDWIAGIWGKALDVSFYVAEANTGARADVVLEDGTVLFSQIPATALLELEKRCGEVQELIKVVPTLDPAKAFAIDPDRAEGIYKAREVRRQRTEKVFAPVVMAPATDKHPAQVKELFKDVPVAEVIEQEWSGMVTPKTKGEMMERVEELRRAVKTARQRANEQEQEVGTAPISTKLFGYVLKGITK